MIGRLDHAALAVPDLAAAAETFRAAFGADVSAAHALPEHGVRVAFVELPNARVELLEPLGDASPLRAFLDRRPGGGLHHLCFEVADVRAARDTLAARGLRALGDGESRLGAHGRPVLFLHPKDLFGALIELLEAPATPAGDEPTFTGREAAEAQTALRRALGLEPEAFPVRAFVGMISDEIEALRAGGADDAAIAALVTAATGKLVTATMIAEHYASPEARGRGTPDGPPG